MKIKLVLFISLILILFSFANCIAATELTNESLEGVVDLDNYTMEDSTNNLKISADSNLNQENQELLSADDSIEIYVGKNITDDGGNGSYSNPYSTLNLACEKVNGEKVTINIFNGTYYLDDYLKFNTSNLIINGINGQVYIKNKYNNLDPNNPIRMALGLTSASSNYTFSNIIYDATEFSIGVNNDNLQFQLFYGSAA